MFDEKTKIEIIKRLSERIPSFECPICHNKNFSIVDGFLIQGIQHQIDSIVLGNGPMVPSVALVCTHCGFMSQHNLGILGMINRDSLE